MLEGLMQHDHPLTLQLVLERARGMNGDAEVELEVALAVPGEGRDAVAALDPELRERVAEPVDPREHVRERRALDAALDRRHHVRVAVHASHAVEDVVQRQRMVVLHQAHQHWRSPSP